MNVTQDLLREDDDIEAGAPGMPGRRLYAYTRGLSFSERFLAVVVVFFSILFFPLALMLCIRFVSQGQCGIVRRFGRWQGEVHQPGVVWLIPLIDDLALVDMRIHTYTMAPQQMLTKDSVSIDVDAVVYYQISDLMLAEFAIDNVHLSTKQLAQTALRDVIGSAPLQTVTSDRKALNAAIQAHLRPITKAWGVQITHVEIKDITLPVDMKHIMAAEAEAVRQANAKVAAAKGEVAAARLLGDAAEEMAKRPGTMQLRYLQTLASIAGDRTNTIVFPADSGSGMLGAFAAAMK